MAFFDESESERPIKVETLQQNNNGPYFMFSEQQKNNLNRRMPRGFCFVKKSDYEKQQQKNIRRYNPSDITIDYNPIKKEHDIDLNNPFISTIQQNWANKVSVDPRKTKMIVQSVQGRNRQTQKIKNIIQRFRKHPKYPPIASYLNRIGMMQALNQIESENKKGLLTIDTFRQRFMLVLQSAKNTTFEEKVKQLIDEIIEDLLCYAEQARKTQFENNIQSIQKSIDKITRYASESNWYIRKRKKGDKADNNYSQKQILYIGDLIRKLPTPYLIGVLQLIQERPINEGVQEQISTLKLFELTNRKLKDIELYVKGKLSLLHRSRQRKLQKLQKKLNKGGGGSQGDDEQKKQQQQQQNSVKKIGYKKQTVEQVIKQVQQHQQSQNRQGSQYEYIKQIGNGMDDDDKLLNCSANFGDELFDEDNESFALKSSRREREEKQSVGEQVGKKEEERVKVVVEKRIGQVNKRETNNDGSEVVVDDDDSMDENDSSDSSMITDEDESDF